VADPVGIEAALMTLIGCPDLCSRAWITDQYDSTVGGQTVKRPGAADAAVVRLEGSKRALALTTDCTPRYVQADPELGGMQAVAETWRNITAVGAKPLAITDNMNFGNPTKPEIMGQFASAIKGMAAACIALDYPVVSGNVSLYNETEGKGILPTPAIGGLGVLEDAADAVGLSLKPGLSLVLIGDTVGHLGQSLWLREVTGREEGPPPSLDLSVERRNGDFVRGQILTGNVDACHDIADGGLLVAVTEMAMAGNTGASLDANPAGIAPHAWYFGEDQSRYIIATRAPGALIVAAVADGVSATHIGTTGGHSLTLADGVTISLESLNREHTRFFAEWMG
jgi:phosphoribosylformylglycinamidine synthase